MQLAAGARSKREARMAGAAARSLLACARSPALSARATLRPAPRRRGPAPGLPKTPERARSRCRLTGDAAARSNPRPIFRRSPPAGASRRACRLEAARSPPASPCGGTERSSAPPRVTFADPPADARRADCSPTRPWTAIRRCTPLAITAGLGGAVAGRPLAIRFVYKGPEGQRSLEHVRYPRTR